MSVTGRKYEKQPLSRSRNQKRSQKQEITDVYKSSSIKTTLLERESYNASVEKPPDAKIFQRTTRRPHLSITEVDILERIVVRENILIEIRKEVERINEECTRGKDGESDIAQFSSVMTLLDTLRYCTVDVIESISAWKSLQTKQGAYLFRGKCYISKIASDLDFLDSYDKFVEYCGFEFSTNPFGYAGGGALIRSAQQDSLLNNYFEIGLMIGEIEMFRVRNCEKEIESCLYNQLLGSSQSITTTISPELKDIRSSTLGTQNQEIEKSSSTIIKAIDPYSFAMESEEYDYEYDGYSNRSYNKQQQEWDYTTGPDMVNDDTKDIDKVDQSSTDIKTPSYQFRFANKK